MLASFRLTAARISWSEHQAPNIGERQFIVLSDAKEEAKLADIHVGFIALNKNSVEWVRLAEEGVEKDEQGHSAYQLY